MTTFQPLPIVTENAISGEEKLRRVANLVRDLRRDLAEVNFLPHERNAAMEQLKVFGRNAANADPIFTREGIEVLTQHSFHTTSPTTSKAALQCLANALLAAPPTRQIFVDLGYSPRAVARLKNPKKDDELLMSRILFLTSYGSSQNFVELIDRHHLAEHINDNIARHAKKYSKLGPKKFPGPGDDFALSETLKLLFNITHFLPQRSSVFNRSISSIFKIIAHRPPTSPALKAPLNHLLNALLNLLHDSTNPPVAKKLLPSKSDLRPAITRLLSAFDAAFRPSTEADSEAALIPLITFLKLIARLSPPEIQSLLRATLVPNKADSKAKLGANSTLSQKIVYCVREPLSVPLHDALCGLLVEVSGRDMESLGESLGIDFTSSLQIGQDTQAPPTPEDEVITKSQNEESEGSLNGSPSTRRSIYRSSTSTLVSSMPTSPASRQSGPWHRRGSSQGTLELNTAGAKPSIRRASGAADESEATSPDTRTSPIYSVPEEEDTAIESEEQEVASLTKMKQDTTSNSGTLGESKWVQHQKQQLRRKYSTDISSPITSSLSEMTMLVLDDDDDD